MNGYATLTALVLMGAMGSAAHADTLDLKVGVAGEADPPWVQIGTDGQLSGMTLDLVAAVCAEIPADCDIVDTAWDGLIPSLRSGKIDLIFSGMGINEEREKVIAFSDPYFSVPRWLVGSKALDVQLDFADPDSFSRFVIGVQTSSTNAAYLKKFLGNGVEIKLYDRQDSLLADVAAGRVDIGMVNAIAAAQYLATPDGADLENKMTVPYDDVLGKGDGVGLRQGEEDLRRSVNMAIARVKEDGTFKELFEQHFPGMIYEP